MKRKNYESPLTLRTEVELEGKFMLEASVFNPSENETGVSISGHEIGNSADYSIGAQGGQNDIWDSDPKSDSFNF